MAKKPGICFFVLFFPGFIFLCVFAFLAGAESAQADPDLSAAWLRGAALSAGCEACHGGRGLSEDGLPGLAGRDRQELSSEMLAFRSGDRIGTVMNRIVSGYSPQELEEIAEWFSGNTGAGKGGE